MRSTQTLSEPDRRMLAGWAADCAERVLAHVSAPDPAHAQILDALARARAFGQGGSSAAVEIRARMIAVKAASAAATPAGAAAARSVAQAAAVAHMGAHALGAAAYAIKAVTLAQPGATVADAEIAWQLARLTAPAREALRRLPPLGTERSGPLGTGLLVQGILGETIRTIQARVAA